MVILSMETNPLLLALDAAYSTLSDVSTGVQLEGVSDDELLAAVRKAAKTAARISALEVALAGEVDQRSTERVPEESLARTHGCRNSLELIQRLTASSARAVRQHLRLARMTRAMRSLVGEVLPPRFQHVAGALTIGDLPTESAVLIADTLVRAGGAPRDAEMAERCLVQAGSGIDLGVPGGDPGLRVHTDNLRLMCRAWEQALDPDGAEPDEEEALRHRSLNLGRHKYGLVSISGWILPEVAAVLGRIFDAVGSPRRRESQPDRSPDQLTEPETRTPAQKRHDIFATAVQIASQAKEMPSLGGAPITVVVQTRKEDMERGSGAGWLHGHDGTLSPVSQSAIRHGACAGATQFMKQDAHGRVAELSTPERLFNGNQRRAIMVRDGGCVIPGCTVPSTWCEIHHVDPHSSGGPTHIDNGAMLCFYHHRTIDTNGWEIRMVRGMPQIKAPPWLDPTGAWHRRDGTKYLLTV